VTKARFAQVAKRWLALARELSLWDERGITRKFYEVILINQGWRLAPLFFSDPKLRLLE
jgi:hypothetical protein